MEFPVRAFLDTVSGSSYVSASIVNKLMLYTASSKINIYNVKIVNLQSDFKLKTELNALDKYVLLSVPNPSYESMLSCYPQLKGVKTDEFQTEVALPIHFYIKGQ